MGVPTIREGEEENEIAVPDNYEELDDDEDSYRSLADIQEEMKEKMQKILRSRTMKGIPLNMPFTDVDEALAKVKLSSSFNLVVS